MVMKKKKFTPLVERVRFPTMKIVLNLIRSNVTIDSLADCTYRRKFFKGSYHHTGSERKKKKKRTNINREKVNNSNTEPFKLPFSRSKSH